MKLWLTRGLIASKGFSKILSMGLLGLFFVYLIIIAGTSAIQEKDVGVFFKQIGEEMFKPLQKAQESALEIIDSEKVSLKQSIWKYFSFWSNLYKIYMWLWAIMFFVNFIFKDSNSGLIRYGVGISMFLTIQVIFSLLFYKESINFVFVAISDIFKALLHLIPGKA